MEKRRPTFEPLLHALDLFGDRWSLLILQSVFLRVRRYDDIRARLGISPTTLSARLRALVDAEVLEQAPYRTPNRTRMEYRITTRGLPLWQLLVSIWFWEKTWVPGRAAELPRLVHLDCGTAVTPELACTECATPVRPREIGAVRNQTAPLSLTSNRPSGGSLAGKGITDPLVLFHTALDIMGDRWSIALLTFAFMGVNRFSGFQRELAIGPGVLAGRLRKLVRVGVLTVGRRGDPTAYRLTAKGLALFPSLAFVLHWCQADFPPDDPSILTVRHRGPNHPFVPVLRCPRCGGLLGRDNTRIDPPTVGGNA
ncbi:winged helix-turn-helix transcriptional regulator [Pseudonocardia eucalypti]|uniref:Winged helix-turn-helix transcriptional regulator n=1 Tax=Pseudonocardia eucalypti TaxID=648755 RepID=A0ABP9QWN6_9PSEU|nr:DNA-binding HxlR family transcriptional regulator [Pseudonocardia eucalypti]